MAETVTIGLRDARIAQDEQNEEWDRALDAARKADKAVRRATGGPQMAFWLTGNADPLLLDFERDDSASATREELLRKLGKQFQGPGFRTGAVVGID